MEVVSVAASVGEVLGGPQTPTPTTFTHDHTLHAHTEHTDRVRTDEDEDEDEGDSRMDTDQDVAVVEDGVPCEPEETSEETSEVDIAILNPDSQTHALEEESNPDADSAVHEDDVTGDHMDCDDSENAPMYIDDDSSSRAYPETVSDMPVGSPSAPMPMPEAGRRNKRKNFKPRNIVYAYTDSEDNDGTSDAETRAQHPSSDSHFDPTTSDLPLDLSETPTVRRSLLPRRLDEAVDLTGGAGVTVGGGSGNSPSAHPRLNALLSRSTSPGQQEEGGGGMPGEGGPGTGGAGGGVGGGAGGGGSNDGADMKEYAELTMRRLLGLYGFNDLSENLALSPAALYQGRWHLWYQRVIITLAVPRDHQLSLPVHALTVITSRHSTHRGISRLLDLVTLLPTRYMFLLPSVFGCFFVHLAPCAVQCFVTLAS
ncbi:location of vulva defective 1-like [Scylla paramamosain]|uniref:location of vulva defective 1-like n=1 Tax=Scylla paramamosain TaxID=85552 RepID=UPI003083B30E